MRESTSHTFPKGFLWGAATAAHQVEGGNRNDWAAWEQKSSKEKVERAKAEKWPAYILDRYPNPLHEENYISGPACGHYSRFREDFDLARSLGHNTHRFSIEWSRIEPEEGRFNEKEIAHYREVLGALNERGMEPFVTLWHFTNPAWFAERGGWENPKAVFYFVRYAQRMAKEFAGLAKFWITINEPTVYAGASYLAGQWPPQVKSILRTNAVLQNLMSAHAQAYGALHVLLGSDAQVGVANNLHYHAPQNRFSPLDWLATAVIKYIRDTRQLAMLGPFQDFIGLNYYVRDVIKFVFGGGRFGFADTRNPNDDVSDMGWDIHPEGLYHALKDLKRFKKPIYITENGIADANDEKRATFVVEHLRWVHKAMQEGADVRGYFYWSLLDNFEWDKGFWPRFGLCEVDYKTLARTPRPSALAYKRICKTNTIE